MKKYAIFLSTLLVMTLNACSSNDEPIEEVNQNEMFTRDPFHYDYELTSEPLVGKMSHQAIPYKLEDFKYPTEQIYLSIPYLNIKSLEEPLYIYVPNQGGSFTLNSGRDYQCITRNVSTCEISLPEGYESFLKYLCEDGEYESYWQREYNLLKFSTCYSAIASSELHNVTFKDDDNVRTGSLELLGCSFINKVGCFECRIAPNVTGKDRIIKVYICENHCQNTEESDNMARCFYICQAAE